MKTKLEQITALPIEQQSNYKPFLLGNDKPIDERMLSKHKQNSEFILLGTALFRSVDIACKIAGNEDIVPQIIIIDNSRVTAQAWKHIQKFFALQEGDIDLDEWLEFIVETLMPLGVRIDSFSSKTGIPHYFKQFFNHYPADYIKKIIASLVVIEQNWENIEMFRQIRALIEETTLVMYASNILDYVSQYQQAQVLAGIHYVQPNLSFYTNLDKTLNCPTLGYVTLENSPSMIGKMLNLPSDVIRTAECQITEENLTIPTSQKILMQDYKSQITQIENLEDELESNSNLNYLQ